MAFVINLVNMPFAMLHAPSIALTQLKSVLLHNFPEEVKVDVHYLNHDFGRMLGSSAYNFIGNSMGGLVTGLGEWMFRQAAFPDAPDNKTAYLRRYAHQLNTRTVAGHANRVVAVREHLNESLDTLIAEHRLAEADVVGLTSMFFQNLPSIALAQRLKRLNPKLIVVMGGANCEGTMGVELVCNVPVIDFVFSGQALVSFPQFVGCLLRNDLEGCHHIDGVFSRRNSHSITSSCEKPDGINFGRLRAAKQLQGVAEQGRELDVNALTSLDYDDFFASFLRHFPQHPDKPVLMFETSRGCWWGERAHCTFCGLNGGTMSYRAMQPRNAIQLLNSLIGRYGDRVQLLQGVDNIMPKEYVNDVFAGFSVPDHIRIFYEVKSDLTTEQLQILGRGGVKRVQPGIESLATSTLKLMRKGTTAFRNIRFLADCTRNGVEPVWNLLVGFPGEDADVYEMYTRVLPSLFHLPPPTGVFPIRFDRFSPYFTLQQEYGLKLTPYDFYSLCYPFPQLVLMNMAYYFQDLNFEASHIRNTAMWMSRLQELVASWQSRWRGEPAHPKLDFIATASGGYVVDTRQGAERRQLLSGADIALLHEISSPTLVERIAPDQLQALERIGNREYSFSERDRVMSIVAGI